ncbi:hypothetical protein RND71_022139 [Anisodus tanguticus]|uniref:Uncharacterized protein n=1 Tax=Anisodus tanguticus TaxID=243964 RepID=A0AAE1RYC6_9SOLA|nr:hypothetical protein RND71_022139 [Anisodus tanguticus]
MALSCLRNLLSRAKILIPKESGVMQFHHSSKEVLEEPCEWHEKALKINKIETLHSQFYGKRDGQQTDLYHALGKIQIKFLWNSCMSKSWSQGHGGVTENERGRRDGSRRGDRREEFEIGRREESEDQREEKSRLSFRIESKNFRNSTLFRITNSEFGDQKSKKLNSKLLRAGRRFETRLGSLSGEATDFMKLVIATSSVTIMGWFLHLLLRHMQKAATFREPKNATLCDRYTCFPAAISRHFSLLYVKSIGLWSSRFVTRTIQATLVPSRHFR